MTQPESLLERARRRKEEAEAEAITASPVVESSVPDPVFPELNTTSSTPEVKPMSADDLFPELKTKEDIEAEDGPGFLKSTANLAGSLVEGAARKAISIGNLSSATVPEPLEEIVDIADEGQNFGTKVASGVGGALTQAGVVAGSAASGALVGSVVPGIGTAIGGAVGGVAGAGTVLVQGIRESLFGVEQETRQEVFNETGKAATEEQLKEARTKALPGVVTGQTLDTLFAVATGGAGSLVTATGKELAKTTAKEVVKGNIKGAAKTVTKAGFEPIRRKAAADFVNAQRKAQFEAVQSAVGRVGRIGKVLENSAKAAVLEGTGEVVEGASTRAAAKSVAKGTSVISEFGSEVASKEALEDFALGAAVQGSIRGGATVREAKLAGRSDFEAGLEVLGEKTDTKNTALVLSEQFAKLENPDNPAQSVVIPDSIASGADLEAIFKNESGFQLNDNKDGTTTVSVTEQASVGSNIEGDSLFQQTHDKSGMLPLAGNKVNGEAQVAEGPLTFEDENGNSQTITRKDVLQERVTLKLLESKGIETQIKLEGPEGTNLKTKEAKTEFGSEGFDALAIKTKAPDSAISTFAKKFDPNRGLPETARRAQVEADQLKSSIQAETAFNAAAMTQAIKGVVDQRTSKGKRSDKAKKDISVQLGKDLQVYLNGMQDINTLPESMRAPAIAMRGSLHRTMLRHADSGAVKGSLAQDIRDNAGVWLHPSFMKDSDPTYADRVANDPEFKPVYNRAKALVKRQLENKYTKLNGDLEGDNAGKSQADFVADNVDKTLMQLMTRGSADLIGTIQSVPEAGRSQLSVFSEIKEHHPAIRALWGEKTNGLENYATTMLKIAHDISQHKYHTDLKYHGLREGYLSNRPNAEKGLVRPVGKLAEDVKSATVHPLDGMFTTKDLAEALKPIPAETHSVVGKLWMTANGFTKYSKTVLNPVTHTRNFFSNPLFLLSNGNFKGILNKDAMNQALKTNLSGVLTEGQLDTLKNKKGADTDSWRQLHLRFVELGLIGESVSAGELHDVMRRGFTGDLTLNQFADQSANKGVARKIAKGIKLDGVINLYQAEDSFWKVVAWNQERQKLVADMEGTLTPDEADVEAARIVSNTMPNFSMLSDGVKEISRKTPFAPFLSFPAEVIRTQINTARQINLELNDPRRRKTGLARLRGMAIAHAAPFAAAAAAKLMLGIDDDEEEAIRMTGAPWDRTGTLLFFGRDKDGMPQYVNLSYTDPFSMFKKSINAASIASKDDRGLMIAALGEFLEPLTSETMLAEKLLEISSNKKKRTGGKVFNDQDDDRVKVAKSIMHAWEAAEPGFISMAQRWYKKAPDATKKDVLVEAAALMTGMRLTKLDAKKSLPFYGRSFKKEKSSISSMFSTPAKFDKDITNDRLATKFNNMMNRRDQSYKILHSRIEAFLTLGMTKEQVGAELRASGAVAKRDLKVVMGFGIPRYRISSQMKKSLKSHTGRFEFVKDLVKKREGGIVGK